MTPEIKELFGLYHKNIDPHAFADENNNVKKGFEIFDLNGDKKIDELENSLLEDSLLIYSVNLKTLENFLSKLDSISGKQADNIITQEEKEAMYQQQVDKKLNELKKVNISNSNGEQVVTQELYDSFNHTTSMSLNDIVDQNDNIKNGFEVFDLNKDGKFDNIERNYFSNKGTVGDSDNDKIEVQDLIKMIKGLDKFTYLKGYERNMGDNSITDEDKANLYTILSSAHYMLGKIQNLPKEFRQQYIDTLKEIEFGDNPASTSIGGQIENKIRLNARNCNKYEAATVLIHELTHYVLSKHTKLTPIEQEVVCFYMEYKLHEEMKKDENYYTSTYRSSVINRAYIDYIDKLKKENPNISEKELAAESFIKYKLVSYSGRTGYETRTPDEIRNADYID